MPGTDWSPQHVTSGVSQGSTSSTLVVRLYVDDGRSFERLVRGPDSTSLGDTYNGLLDKIDKKLEEAIEQHRLTDPLRQTVDPESQTMTSAAVEQARDADRELVTELIKCKHISNFNIYTAS